MNFQVVYIQVKTLEDYVNLSICVLYILTCK